MIWGKKKKKLEQSYMGCAPAVSKSWLSKETDLSIAGHAG